MKDRDEWCRQLLGVHADEILYESGRGAVAAHAEAVSAQAAQSSRARDTYGHTLKVAKHEQVNKLLAAIPGVEVRPVRGLQSRFRLPVVTETNVAIIPMRARTADTRRAHNLCRLHPSDLFRVFFEPVGPVPEEQRSLFESDTEADGESPDDVYLMKMVNEGRAVALWINASYEGIYELGLGVFELLPSDSTLMDIRWPHWSPLSTVEQKEVTKPTLQLIDEADPVDRFDAEEGTDDFGLQLRPQHEDYPDAEQRETDEKAEDGESQ